MGPRLFGQGKYLHWQRIKEVERVLQWGLACSGKVRQGRAIVRQYPCELQWGLACSGKVRAVVGKTATRRMLLQWGLACSGKVSAIHLLRALAALCASMGPRLFGQGKSRWSRRGGRSSRMLQWGLACSGKVRLKGAVDTLNQWMLQWGLACSGKVRNQARQLYPVLRRLQWGLACSGKVRSASASTQPTSCSFNGASPVRAR